MSLRQVQRELLPDRVALGAAEERREVGVVLVEDAPGAAEGDAGLLPHVALEARPTGP